MPDPELGLRQVDRVTSDTICVHDAVSTSGDWVRLDAALGE